MVSVFGAPYFNKLEEIPPLFFEHTQLAQKTAAEIVSVSAVLASVGADYSKLTPENLDDLVLALIYAPSPAVDAALISSANGRVMSLIWSLFQFDYANENILNIMAAITKTASYTKFLPAEGQMAFMNIKGLAFTQNPLAVLTACILNHKEPLSVIPEKYGLITKAPFFKDASVRVLAHASADFLKENFSLIDSLFREGNIPVTVLIRYLAVIPAEEFSPDICLVVTEKLGAPPDGDFWKSYPADMGQKIINWNKIYKMALAYPSDGKKYKFFGKYGHKLTDTLFDRDTGIVRLLFGQFTIIDDLSNENEFIMSCDPKASSGLKSLKKLPALMTARDYIVKGSQAEYIRISLSGLDKMYADELFDTLLDM